MNKNLITVRGLVASLDGTTIYKLEKTGPTNDAKSIGGLIGKELIKMGAGEILKNVYQ